MPDIFTAPININSIMRIETRLNLGKEQPGAYQAMDALDTYISQTSIDKISQELIRIRASQINGCAFCVNYHTEEAIRQGEAWSKLQLINVWSEAENVFSKQEQLMLRMTEEITLIHRHGLSTECYEEAIEQFGTEKTAQIIMVIVTINAWNRIGVSLKMKPKLQLA